MRNESLESACIDGRLLRVEFNWLGDRFGHLISAVHKSGEIRPLLESIEGAATDNWPPSPPLQSLSIETFPDGRRVALLVGMAGGSHWSASVEAVPDRAEFLFDLACRHAKQPTCLGNQYQRLSKSRDASVISNEGNVTESQTAITIAPRVVAAAETTRWKFTVRLLNPEP